MAIDARLQRLLDDEGVGYEIIHHVDDRHITFNAGNHCDALRMVWEDYARLAKPEVVHLSHHEEEAQRAGSA